MNRPRSPASRFEGVPALLGEAAALRWAPSLLSAGFGRDERAGAVPLRTGPAAAAASWTGLVAGCEGAAAVLAAGWSGVALTAGTGVAAGCGAAEEDVPPPAPAGPATDDGMLPSLDEGGPVAPATLTVPATRLGCDPFATLAWTVMSQSPGGRVAVPLQMPSMAVPATSVMAVIWPPALMVTAVAGLPSGER